MRSVFPYDSGLSHETEEVILVQDRMALEIQLHSCWDAFKSSYVNRKFKENQIAQGWLPAIRLAVVILLPWSLLRTKGSCTLALIGKRHQFAFHLHISLSLQDEIQIG